MFEIKRAVDTAMAAFHDAACDPSSYAAIDVERAKNAVARDDIDGFFAACDSLKLSGYLRSGI